MKKLLLLVALSLTIGFATKAQDETVTENPAEVVDTKTVSLEDLKTQRAALVAMVQSEEFQSRIAKMDKLKVPTDVGIEGLDALTVMAAKLLEQMKTTRGAIPQFYASITGQSLDGSPTGQVATIQPDQLIALSKMFITMGIELVKSSKSLVSMPGEIKSAGFGKALKALKSMAYIKNAFVALKHEISYNAKMTQNLIATNKAMSLTAGK